MTEDRLEKALEARRLSMTIRDAAAAAGIDRSTHENWFKRGEEDASAGRETIFAQYFRLLPMASAEGAARRLMHVERIARKRKATAVDVQRGRLMLGLAAMMATREEVRARLRLERRRLEIQARLGLPMEPAPQEQPTSYDFSRLGQDELSRYRELAARCRQGFATVTPAEVAELQTLLRKMAGADEAPKPQPTVDSPPAPVLE